MNLQSQRELEVVGQKLKMLEEQCEAAQAESNADEHVREVTLQSLKKRIHRLREETV